MGGPRRPTPPLPQARTLTSTRMRYPKPRRKRHRTRTDTQLEPATQQSTRSGPTKWTQAKLPLWVPHLLPQSIDVCLTLVPRRGGTFGIGSSRLNRSSCVLLVDIQFGFLLTRSFSVACEERFVFQREAAIVTRGYHTTSWYLQA